MTRALLVGIFTAISTAILGNFIITARQAVTADMLSHTALAGVGLGIFWNIAPTHTALITTIISALTLLYLNRKKDQAPEALSMLLLTGGLAIALLLAHLNKNNPISLDTYLFGSILTITQNETSYFILLNILIIATLIIFWKPFLTLVFDPHFLQTKTQKPYHEIIFLLLIAIIVGIGLKVIGSLLIGALLIIPALIAQIFTQSFQQNVLLSIIINMIAIITGLITSFYLDVPSSSAIVLSLISIYIISLIWKNALLKNRNL